VIQRCLKQINHHHQAFKNSISFYTASFTLQTINRVKFLRYMLMRTEDKYNYTHDYAE